MFGAVVLVVAISANQLVTGQQKARDAQRRADVELVGRAMEAYFGDFQIYPEATESGQIVSCGDRGADVCRWGNDMIVDHDNVVYLKNLPGDPWASLGRQYKYVTDEYRSKFRIYTALEYEGDPVVKHDLTEVCGNNVQCNWYVESNI